MSGDDEVGKKKTNQAYQRKEKNALSPNEQSRKKKNVLPTFVVSLGKRTFKGFDTTAILRKWK